MTSEPLAELGRDSLVGAYRIVREIGRGGMATVYEASHTVLPRRAALKIMHGDLRRQPGMATRVVQEATILDSVRHPGVVRVYDCNVLPDHRPWIAMELVEGETLAERLHGAIALPPIEVATLLGDVAEVLAAVHRTGIVHRDLKPDNLLCTPTDHDFPIRVLDWGVARLGPIGRLTMDGLTPGTPIYMSPEQATGNDIGPACDVYSLGVIAYEALSGRPPFDGRTLAEVVCMHLTRAPAPLRGRCNAPVELCELVARMLHKAPSQRPTADEVRTLARAIARDISHAYEEFELSDGSTYIAPSPPPSDGVPVVDAEALEFGITEMLPIVCQPRWTPELGALAGGMTSVLAMHDQMRDRMQDRPGAIAPRSPRDQVAGEIVLGNKPR